MKSHFVINGRRMKSVSNPRGWRSGGWSAIPPMDRAEERRCLSPIGLNQTATGLKVPQKKDSELQDKSTITRGELKCDS